MQQKPPYAPPIAVIGMAARFPGAENVEQYWTNLVDGVESSNRPSAYDSGLADGARNGQFVQAVARLDGVDLFDAEHFRIQPTEAVVMDPQQRVLLEVAAEALEDAGYAGDRDGVVGVFVGSGENHYFRDHVAPAEAGAGRSGDVRVTLANEKDFLAPRIAFKLGFNGPAVTVQTGCATALTAVALACSALAAGDCDIALAGGVSLLMPDVEGYTYTDGGILSADGRCRAFDARASGTIPGSGAGVVVLRRESDARAARDHRRAVVRGWAVNNDGGSRGGFTVPNIDGQEAVIRAALARADVKPDQVGYVETHGTGTAIGDPVEFEALRRVFATAGRPAGSSLTLGAVKPNIGHTDAAAGVAGLIKAALAVERATIPGTLHFSSPNPEIDLDATPFSLTSQTRPWDTGGPRIAGVSSFGLGGSNAHVVLESAPAAPPASAPRPRHVLALSARSDDELERMRERLADRLEAAPADGAALADVAYTLGVGRARYARRWAAVVTDCADAVARLRAPAEAGRPTARWSLAIHGTPDELAATGERLLADEPSVRSALAGLTGRAGLDGLAPERAGALTALGVARALLRLGLTFARVDAPAWARPAAQWLTTGADPATLDAALDACTADADAGSVREGAGRIVVGPAFDLADVAAAAWRAGVAVDWAAYYGDEPRGRVPLPTYPFTRRRFWLDRPEPQAEPDRSPAPTATRSDTTDVTAFVERVWLGVLGVERIAHDAHFLDDLGGDSLHAVEIGARLNEELGLDLPIDLPFIAPTIEAASTYVEQALATETSS
ncbi:beta-ketoacyl synthase N-terminal-like domain-containing protein [Streptomyces sp. NPDC032940]|uniref:beta-ketoacyl synthase N-terminal-like domain-containing protein n=1 Tax=Streptomyces sp. NPDC032940 TaxID=3155366 RepID=UPI0033EF8C34